MQAKSRWRWVLRAFLALLGVAGLTLAYIWFARERIAADMIDTYLTDSGLEASYDIVSIGTQRQVIENLVIGDSEAPDLTIDRLIVDVTLGPGAASISSAIVERPRLYGSYRDGTLSFGALDALLFAQSDEPVDLPAMDVRVVDGGAMLATDYGDVGAYLTGSGRLDDGFEGKLAVTAPGIEIEGCRLRALTAYGDLRTHDGTPSFAGPVRMGGADCLKAVIESVDIGTDFSLDLGSGGISGQLNLSAGRIAYEGNSAASAQGTANAAYRDGNLTLDHRLSLTDLASPYGSFKQFEAKGDLRSQNGFARSDWSVQIEGQGATIEREFSGTLAQMQSASEGTFVAPLLARLNREVAAATRGGQLTADITWRVADGRQSVVIPDARFQTARDETVLAVSRFAWRSGSTRNASQLSGNFLTGGAGLPRINGRMEQVGGAGIALRMAMAEYSEGADRIALPSLSVRQDDNGTFRFSGSLEAGGALPGGSIAGLQVPINGRLAPSGAVQLGLTCETVRFAALAYYDLALEQKSVRLCPVEGRAMLQYTDALSIAARTDNIAITGMLAESPSAITADAAVLRYPGDFALDNLNAVIGDKGNAITIAAARITGAFGDKIGGAIDGASARLDIIPLNLDAISGRWAYAAEAFSMTDADFVLTERIEGAPRFEPLRARGARLTFADGVINGQATLQNRARGVNVVDVALTHDVSSATGWANLDVPAITFGDGLSLTDLTDLATGVVAYTDGTVTGQGRIGWVGDEIESEGVFRSDGLDLAAAFGPVKQLKGEVRFADLVNLTTEPGQVLEIGAINPGIEVLGGKLRFSMTDGELIEVEDARWPFMGGTLVMRPTQVRYGTDEEQRYTFEMIALDAAKFVAQMELSNIGATGEFDGTVPIIFDVDGNGRIEGGLLISRQPGGSVSYIGELTYEDMGAMANYAFQSLRSLDYSQMSVELNGDLAGEIITRFQFDGVRQGEGASRNFVTRRLAKLPIRFNVNVRSENFYELATMARRFWDPSALPDPIDQGLLNTDGTRFVIPPERLGPNAPPNTPPEPTPSDALRPDEKIVQPPESEPMP